MINMSDDIMKAVKSELRDMIKHFTITELSINRWELSDKITTKLGYTEFIILRGLITFNEESLAVNYVSNYKSILKSIIIEYADPLFFSILQSAINNVKRSTNGKD